MGKIKIILGGISTRPTVGKYSLGAVNRLE